MNKRAQSIITVFFWVLVFAVIYIFFFMDFLNMVQTHLIEVNELTGVSAFLVANLELIIFVALGIAALAWSAGGGG